jgi:iron complex transport system ATP-binding protein
MESKRSSFMLTLNNVSAGYEGVDVVKSVSFSVGSSERLSIIGPNGCGKTTLLKAISGILPFSGEIEIDKKLVSKMKPREKSQKISLLSQISGLYFSYSVYDTVMMGRYLHIKEKFIAVPSERDKQVVLKCLEAVDLVRESDRLITALSGGQLQRVFLARALAQEPEIILLDEPTNHLDLKYQIEFIEYLKIWAEEGSRSIIGVMHDLNLAMKLSDNIMVMKDGEIAALGKCENVLTGDLLATVFEIDVAKYMRESLARGK